MTFIFKKGKHRARPLYWLRWWPLLVNPRKISFRVTFTYASKYELPGIDQQDHNKLFGLGYINPRRNSARFGWRYNSANQKFILSAFMHINGEMHFEDLCECVANHYYDCSLLVSDDEYFFIVIKESGEVIARMAYSKGHRRKLALLLGPYFGGNNAAPDNLIIQLKKK